MAEQYASKEETGTSDPTYNTISVIYHSLHGAETYEKYVRDAERDGDQELADYFRSGQDALRDIAERGKPLLEARLGS